MAKRLGHIIAKKKSSTEGELYLYGDIGNSWDDEGITDKKVIAELRKLGDAGVKDLTIFVNSGGGNVFQGMAIYNAIKRFEGSKTVVVDGLAASCASLIAMAGSKIKMSKASLMMVHEASTFAGGKSQDMKDVATQLDKVNESMIAVYAERTGQPLEVVKKLVGDETWMTADEAVANRFADEIITNSAEIEQQVSASASPLLASYRKIPESLRAVLARGYTPAAAARHIIKEHKMELTVLALALGLAASATENEILAHITKMRMDLLGTAGNKEASTSLSEINALTGKASAAESKGIILAWKQSHDQIGAYQAEKALREAAEKTARVSSLVNAGVAAGKIPPAMKEFWASQGNANLATLEGFLAAAPVLVTSPVLEKPVEPGNPGLVLAINEDEQEKIFKAAGVTDPKQKAEIRAQVAKQNAELARHGVKLSSTPV